MFNTHLLSCIPRLTPVEIYGDSYLKYNHHWSTHISAQIPDCGPVYGFWEFPGERVNKTLKNINTNNHRAGELEITMLREYNSASGLSQMVRLSHVSTSSHS